MIAIVFEFLAPVILYYVLIRKFPWLKKAKNSKPGKIFGGIVTIVAWIFIFVAILSLIFEI